MHQRSARATNKITTTIATQARKDKHFATTLDKRQQQSLPHKGSEGQEMGETEKEEEEEEGKKHKQDHRP